MSYQDLIQKTAVVLSKFGGRVAKVQHSPSVDMQNYVHVKS